MKSLNEVAPNYLYVTVLIDRYDCMLVTGVGKVPYDPAAINPKTGKPYRMYTAIKIDLIPLPEMNLRNPISRDCVQEFGEWQDFILPSILKIGGDADALLDNGHAAKIELVDNGETFVSRTSGETVHKKYPKFVAIYPDEATCRAAYEKEQGTPHAAPPTEQPPDSQPQANGNKPDSETRQKLIPFVKMIVTKAKTDHPGDLLAIGQEVSVKIAEHSTLRNYFTPTDADVMELISESDVPF